MAEDLVCGVPASVTTQTIKRKVSLLISSEFDLTPDLVRRIIETTGIEKAWDAEVESAVTTVPAGVLPENAGAMLFCRDEAAFAAAPLTRMRGGYGHYLVNRDFMANAGRWAA